MTKANEKTRTLNFLKKQMDVNTKDVHAVSEAYKNLYEVQKQAKAELDKLKSILIEDNLQTEFFPEDQVKVCFQKGSKITELNSHKLASIIPFEEFVSLAKITESAIKKMYDENQACTLIGSTRETTGQRSDTVAVRKMTKAELV